MKLKKLLIVLLTTFMCVGIFQTKSSKVKAQDASTGNKHTITLNTDSQYGIFATKDGNKDVISIETDEQGNLINLDASSIPTIVETNTNYIFDGFYDSNNTKYYNNDGTPAITNINEDITLTAKWTEKTLENDITKGDTKTSNDVAEYNPNKPLYYFSYYGEFRQTDDGENYYEVVDSTNNSFYRDENNYFHIYLKNFTNTSDLNDKLKTDGKAALYIVTDNSGEYIEITLEGNNSITVTPSYDGESCLAMGIYHKNYAQGYGDIIFDGTGNLNININKLSNTANTGGVYGIWGNQIGFGYNDLGLEYTGKVTIQIGESYEAVEKFQVDSVGIFANFNLYMHGGNFDIKTPVKAINYSNIYMNEDMVIAGNNQSWSDSDDIQLNVYDGWAMANESQGIKYDPTPKSLKIGSAKKINYHDGIELKTSYVMGSTTTIEDINETNYLKQRSENKFFLGWKKEGDESGKIYLPGETLEITDNATFIAQWVDNIDFTLVCELNLSDYTVKFYKDSVSEENEIPRPLEIYNISSFITISKPFSFITSAPTALKITTKNEKENGEPAEVTLNIPGLTTIKTTNTNNSVNNVIGIDSDANLRIVLMTDGSSVSANHAAEVITANPSATSTAIKAPLVKIDSKTQTGEACTLKIEAGNANDPDTAKNIGILATNKDTKSDTTLEINGTYLDINASTYPISSQKLPKVGQLARGGKLGVYMSTSIDGICNYDGSFVETTDDGYVVKDKNNNVAKHVITRELNESSLHLKFDASTGKFYEVNTADPSSPQETSITSKEAYEKYGIYNKGNTELHLLEFTNNLYANKGLEITGADVTIVVDGKHTLNVTSTDYSKDVAYGIYSDHKIKLIGTSNLTINVSYMDRIVSGSVTAYGIYAKALEIPTETADDKTNSYSGELTINVGDITQEKSYNCVGIETTSADADSFKIGSGSVTIKAGVKDIATEVDYAVKTKSEPTVVGIEVLGIDNVYDKVSLETRKHHDTTSGYYYYTVQNKGEKLAKSLTFKRASLSYSIVYDVKTGNFYKNSAIAGNEIDVPAGITKSEDNKTLTFNNVYINSTAKVAFRIINGNVTINLADNSVNTINNYGSGTTSAAIYNADNSITFTGSGKLYVIENPSLTNYTNAYGIVANGLTFSSSGTVPFKGTLDIKVDVDGEENANKKAIGIYTTGTQSSALYITGGNIYIKALNAAISSDSYIYSKLVDIIGCRNLAGTPSLPATMYESVGYGYTYITEYDELINNLAIEEVKEKVTIKYAFSGDPEETKETGTLPSDEIIKKGSNYTTNNNSTGNYLKREGYTFTGWTYTDDQGEEHLVSPGSVIENVTGDLTLKATWEENNFTLYWDSEYNYFRKNDKTGDFIFVKGAKYNENKNALILTDVTFITTAPTAIKLGMQDSTSSMNVYVNGTNKFKSTHGTGTGLETISKVQFHDSGSITFEGNSYGVNGHGVSINNKSFRAIASNNENAVGLNVKETGETLTIYEDKIDGVDDNGPTTYFKGYSAIKAPSKPAYSDSFEYRGTDNYDTEESQISHGIAWDAEASTYKDTNQASVAKQVIIKLDNSTVGTVYANGVGLWNNSECTDLYTGQTDLWSVDNGVITLKGGFKLDKGLFVVGNAVLNIEKGDNNEPVIINSESNNNTIYVANFDYNSWERIEGLRIKGNGVLQINSPEYYQREMILADRIVLEGDVEVDVNLKSYNSDGKTPGICLSSEKIKEGLNVYDNAKLVVTASDININVPIEGFAPNLSNYIATYKDDQGNVQSAIYKADPDNNERFYFYDTNGNKVNNVTITSNNGGRIKKYSLYYDGMRLYGKYNNELIELNDNDKYFLKIGADVGDIYFGYDNVHYDFSDNEFITSAPIALEIEPANDFYDGLIKLKVKGNFTLKTTNSEANSYAMLVNKIPVIFEGEFEYGENRLNLVSGNNDNASALRINNNSDDYDKTSAITFENYNVIVGCESDFGNPVTFYAPMMANFYPKYLDGYEIKNAITKKIDNNTYAYVDENGNKVNNIELRYAEDSDVMSYTLRYHKNNNGNYFTIYINGFDLPISDYALSEMGISQGESFFGEPDIVLGEDDGPSDGKKNTFMTSATTALEIVDDDYPSAPRAVSIGINPFYTPHEDNAFILGSTADNSTAISYKNGNITIKQASDWKNGNSLYLTAAKTAIECKNLTIEEDTLLNAYISNETNTNYAVNVSETLTLVDTSSLTAQSIYCNNLILNMANLQVGSVEKLSLNGLFIKNKLYYNSVLGNVEIGSYNEDRGAAYIGGGIVYGNYVRQDKLLVYGATELEDLVTGNLKTAAYDPESKCFKLEDENVPARLLRFGYFDLTYVFIPGLGVCLTSIDTIKDLFEAMEYLSPQQLYQYLLTIKVSDQDLNSIGMKLSNYNTVLELNNVNISTASPIALMVLGLHAMNSSFPQEASIVLNSSENTIESVYYPYTEETERVIRRLPFYTGISIIDCDLTIESGSSAKNKLNINAGVAGISTYYNNSTSANLTLDGVVVESKAMQTKDIEKMPSVGAVFYGDVNITSKAQFIARGSMMALGVASNIDGNIKGSNNYDEETISSTTQIYDISRLMPGAYTYVTNYGPATSVLIDEIIKTYTINVDKPIYGIIGIDGNKTSAKPGDIVSLSYNGGITSKLYAWSVKKDDGTLITVNNNKFTMPKGNVTISALELLKDVNEYTISKDQNSEAISINRLIQNAGGEVILTPASDKVLATLSVVDANGDNIGYTTNGDGTYSFTMPASNVIVKATYTNNQDNSYIHIIQRDGGNVYVEDDIVSAESETIKLKQTPDSNHTFEGWEAFTIEGEKITITDDQFDMPDCDVYVMANYKLKENGVDIVVDESAKLYLMLSTVSQVVGKDVTVTIMPSDKTYVSIKGIYTDTNGMEKYVNIYKEKHNTYKFEVPSDIGNEKKITLFGDDGTANKRNITVNMIGDGDFEIEDNKIRAVAGEKIYFYADTEYLTDLSITDKYGNTVRYFSEGKEEYYFVMPDSDVTINVEFEGGSEEGTHISMCNTIDGIGGTIYSDEEYVARGETVTLTVYPDEGYYIDAIRPFYYTDTYKQRFIKVEYAGQNDDGYDQYTFVVPTDIPQWEGVQVNYTFCQAYDTEYIHSITLNQNTPLIAEVYIVDETGTEYCNPLFAREGNWVQIQTYNDTTDLIADASITYKDSEGNVHKVPYYKQYKKICFEMPAGDVTINLTTKIVDSITDYSSAHIMADPEGGSITFEGSSDEYMNGITTGSTIRLNVIPDEGFELSTLTINGVKTYDWGYTEYVYSNIPVTKIDDTTYSFVVPMYHDEIEYQISAEFVKKDEEYKKVTVSEITGLGITPMREIFDEGTGLTAYTSLIRAKAGDTVYLTFGIEEGYEYIENTLKVNNGEVEVEYDEGRGYYYFTMPDKDVTITAEASRVGDIQFSFDGETTEIEGFEEPTQRHIVKVGDKVEFTVKVKDPDNYEVVGLTLWNKRTDQNLAPVNEGPVKDGDKVIGNKYSFIMPSGAASIFAIPEVVSKDSAENMYPITINDDEDTKKLITCYKLKAQGGVTVDFLIENDDGMVPDFVIECYEDEQWQEYHGFIYEVNSNGTVIHMYMPNAPVRIKALVKFNATIDEGVQHATITLDKDPGIYKYGEKPIITITPDDGYVIDSIIAKGEKGSLSVTPIKGETNKYTFMMPSRDVEISAELSEVNKYSITILQGEGGYAYADGYILRSEPGKTIKLHNTLDQQSSNDYELLGYAVYEKGKYVNLAKYDETNGWYFEMPEDDVTVTPIYNNAASAHDIEILESENGEIKCDLSSQSSGDKVYLTAIPEDGFDLSTLVVKDENDLNIAVYKDDYTGKYYFTMPSSKVTVKATFERGHSIIIDSTLGGTISTVGDVYLSNSGNEITLKCATKPGYTFNHWIVTTEEEEPQTVEVTNNKFIMPGKDVRVTAEFDAEPYSISKIINDEESTELGEISIFEPAAEEYHAGETIRFMINPKSGNTVKSVKATTENGVEITPFSTKVEEVGGGEDTIYSFTMPAGNAVIKAQIVESTMYDINVNKPTNGEIVANNGNRSAKPGDDIVVTVTPATGFALDKLYYTKGASSYEYTVEQDPDGNYRFVMPTGDIQLYAEFRQDVFYDVTQECTGPGYVEMLTGDYGIGNEVKFTTHANEAGNDVTGLSVVTDTGETVAFQTETTATSITYKFIMPAANVIIKPTFEKVNQSSKITVTNGEGIYLQIEGDKQRANFDEQINYTLHVQPGYSLSNATVSARTTNPNAGGTYEIINVNPNEQTGYFMMPTKDVTISCTTQKISNTVRVDKIAGEGETIVTNQPSLLTVGKEVDIKTTPESGYYLQSLKAEYVDSNGETQTIHIYKKSDNVHTFTMPGSTDSIEVVISVEFAPLETNKISVQSVVGGKIIVSDGLTQAIKDTVINITPSASLGYDFTSAYYKTSSGQTTIVDNQFTMPNEDVIIGGVFTPKKYALDIQGASHGTVTPTVVSDTYDFNSEVTLKITPETGYQLTKISATGPNGEYVPLTLKSINTYTFKVPAYTTTIKAEFEEGQHKIYLSKVGTYADGGAVSAEVYRDSKYVSDVLSAGTGEKVYIKTTPYNGYKADRITVKNGETQQIIKTNTDDHGTYITMPDDPIVIQVSFALKQYEVNTPSSVTGGTIYTSPDGYAYFKDYVAVYAAPNTGYRLSTIKIETATTKKPITLYQKTIDGQSVTVFEMPSEDVNVTPVFTQIKYNVSVSGSSPTYGSVKLKVNGSSVSSAGYNDRVDIETTVKDGFSIKDITVDGADRKQDEKGYYFIMPQNTVLVEVEWGPCGTIYWGVNSSGELHLSSKELIGEFTTKNTTDGVFADEESIPWKDSLGSITKVVFDAKIAPSQTKYWFAGLSKLESIDNLNYLNTEFVTDMSSMFKGCSSGLSEGKTLELDLSTLKTKEVTNMSSMFEGCTNLTNVNISKFASSNLVNTSSMFSGCTKLESISWPSTLSTSKVTDMSSMFKGCEALTELDISSFNNSQVNNTSNMFDGCTALKTIYASSSWTGGAGSGTSTDMFNGNTALVGGNGTKYVANNNSSQYAYIDDTNPGYFTEKGKFKLIYDVGAGTLPQGQKVCKSLLPGQAYGTLPEPTSTETFMGWYDASTGGNQVTKDTLMGEKETTIYARYNSGHTISYEDDGNGTVEGETTASTSSNVTVTVTPNAGYKLNTLTYKASTGDPVDIDKTTKTFVMPGDDITVKATFVPDQDVKKDVTVKSGITHGNLEVNKKKAYVTEDVVITVTPDTGYELNTSTLKVTYNDGSVKTITPTLVAGKTNQYEFKMPAYASEISGEFKAKTYTVAIDANGGTAGSKQSVVATYGEDMPALTKTGELPSRFGYTLTGLFDAKTSGTKYYNATGTSAKAWDKANNSIVYAQWSANSQAISYGTFEHGSVTGPSSSTTDAKVTLTVTPNDGYKLETIKATYNDGSVKTITPTLVAGTTDKYEFKMPAYKVTVTATFVIDTSKVYNVTAPGKVTGGTITVSPTSGNVETVINVTAQADTGYKLKANSLTYKPTAGGAAKQITGSSFKLPAYHTTVSGEFEVDKTQTFDITLGATEHGSVSIISPTTKKAYTGQDVTLSVTPDAGYKLKSLTYTKASGGTVAITNNKFKMPNDAVTVNAEFEFIPTVFNVNIPTVAHGKVVASPASGTMGQEITLNIEADPGYKLKDNSLKVVNDTTKEEIEVVDNKFALPFSSVTVTAEFEIDTEQVFNVSIGELEHGSITANPTSGNVETLINLTITPEKGYKFKEGSLKYTTSKGAEVVITGTSFKLPGDDVTISAEFEAIPAYFFYTSRVSSKEETHLNEIYMTIKNSSGENTTSIVEMRANPIDAYTEITDVKVTQPKGKTGEFVSAKVVEDEKDPDAYKKVEITALRAIGKEEADYAVVTVTLRNVTDASKPFNVSFKVYVTSEIESSGGNYVKGSEETPVFATDEELKEFLVEPSKPEETEPLNDCYEGKPCSVKLESEEAEPLIINEEYKASEGSVRITLTQEILNSLKPGDHYLILRTKNAVTKIPFKVYDSVKPSPTPGKDESCEKVIGPTWHWNNKKGICEDTGVVRTYSK